jgi:hypothetical protein
MTAQNLPLEGRSNEFFLTFPQTELKMWFARGIRKVRQANLGAMWTAVWSKAQVRGR